VRTIEIKEKEEGVTLLTCWYSCFTWRASDRSVHPKPGGRKLKSQASSMAVLPWCLWWRVGVGVAVYACE